MKKVYQVSIILYKNNKVLTTIEREFLAHEAHEITDIVSTYVQRLEVSLDGFNFVISNWFYQNVLA
jgi:hypothetical protein